MVPCGAGAGAQSVRLSLGFHGVSLVIRHFVGHKGAPE